MEFTILLLSLFIVFLIVVIISEAHNQSNEKAYYEHKLQLAEKRLHQERVTHLNKTVALKLRNFDLKHNINQ